MATLQKNTSTKPKAPPPPAPKTDAPVLSAAQKAANTRKANAAAAKGNTKPLVAPAKKPAAPVSAKKPQATQPAAETETEAEPTLKVGRKELAGIIREKVMAAGKGLPLDLAGIAVVAYEEAVAETLAAGGEVVLPGFGKFRVKDVPEREGRNPQSGEAVTIGASKKVTFKVGAKLKAVVNGNVATEEAEETEEATEETAEA